MSHSASDNDQHLREAPLLALVVPCYNEEEALPGTAPVLLDLLSNLTKQEECKPGSCIVFVDDGSKDRTWAVIEDLIATYPKECRGVKLAVNAGHQRALMAGLDYALQFADATITVDADLQDDLSAIEEMLEKYRSGDEVVLGVRSNRSSDSFFKRFTATLYYKLLRMMGVKITEQHADYRLLSRAAMENLKQYSEYHLFLRGLPELLHARISKVYYTRAPRLAGETKYPTRRMLSLAWNGITSFSVFPLRVISILGALVFLISTALALYAIISRVGGDVVPGWASITAPLYALGGMIMLSIGVLGEYVGKIYIEVKRRPRYLVEKVLPRNDEQQS